MALLITRPLAAADIPVVLGIQALAYPHGLLETAATFEVKRRAHPAGCLGCVDGDVLAGYAFSHPWTGGQLAPLHAGILVVPREPDCMYLHDVAVHPGWRGKGVAMMLVDAVLAVARQEGLERVELVAVGDAGAFWERRGFVTRRRFEYTPGVPAMLMDRTTG